MDGREGKHYEGGIESLVFSLNSQRLAYLVLEGPDPPPCRGGRFVVVDRQDGKRYDDVKKDSLVFSPDSQRLAYVALVFERRKGFLWDRKVGESHMVVIDRQEGSRYDGIVAPPEGGGIISDSPNQLHYIARKGNAFYLVEEHFP